jgi:hypothetical protein
MTYTTIIAGRFDHIAPAESAAQDLQDLGVQPFHLCSFHLNPSGAHGAAYDKEEANDEGATNAAEGGVAGAAVGAAALMGVTAAIAPPLAIAAAGVGAYTGSLVGALATMKDAGEASADSVARKAGIMVAVKVSDKVDLDLIAATLTAHGADTVEISSGVFEGGQWLDFDPTSSPTLYIRPRQD